MPTYLLTYVLLGGKFQKCILCGIRTFLNDILAVIVELESLIGIIRRRLLGGSLNKHFACVNTCYML